jgi:hypothetical protein
VPNDDLERARAESAELLGLNPGKLTPAGALKFFAERDAIKFVQYGCSTEHYVSMTLDDTG